MAACYVNSLTAWPSARLGRRAGHVVWRQCAHSSSTARWRRRNPSPHSRGSSSGIRCTSSTSSVPGLTVRPAVEADLEALVTIEDLSREGGNWGREQVLAELQRDIAVAVVADVAGVAQGWLVAWQVPPDELQILQIAVHPGSRRQGLGSALLHSLLNEHRGAAQVCLLEVRASNVGAIRLYERAGFQRVGVRRRYYSDNEDAVLYNLELSPL